MIQPTTSKVVHVLFTPPCAIILIRTNAFRPIAFRRREVTMHDRVRSKAASSSQRQVIYAIPGLDGPPFSLSGQYLFAVGYLRLNIITACMCELNAMKFPRSYHMNELCSAFQTPSSCYSKVNNVIFASSISVSIKR
jgi:hypothetical protein